MLFPNDVLSPDAIPDPRAAAALRAALASPRPLLRPLDLLAAAARHGGPALADALAKALRPPHSLPALLDALDRASPAPGSSEPPGPRGRDSFAPGARAALDELAEALAAAEGVLDRVAVELLAYFALNHLGAEERRLLPALDPDRAQVALFERVLGGADFRPMLARAFGPLGQVLFAPDPEDAEAPPDEADDGPWELPADLAPSRDLTHAARTARPFEGSPFAGDPDYDALFAALERALCRHHSRHALLAGERGVGKADLVAELARRAASGEVPSLAGRRFVQADARHLPPEQARARLAALLAHAAPREDLVLALDGLPQLLDADPAGCRALLLSALRAADCRLLALVSPREADRLCADDPDFAELFTRVDVQEPSPEAALPLLRHYARSLEERFGLAVEDEAVRKAAALTADYVWSDQLPAKALRVLARVCEDRDFDRAKGHDARGSVTADDVVRAVSGLTGVPEETLRGVAAGGDYAAALRESVVGQERAVRAVADELGLIRAGMTDPGRPASVLLLLGQTGTGKTELAKALARLYSGSGRPRVYTLGNCVEPHAVAGIIGVPPGYVGHDRGGRLVNELAADPYGVFLLDEADKAHPDVLQPFLNLFDEGWVEDQRGARACADRAIFVLTSNVGQRMIAEMAEQGKPPEEVEARMKEALSQIRHPKSDRPVFAPEFLARVKRVVVFDPLSAGAMAGIARKLAGGLAASWEARRGKALEVPEGLVEQIGAEAHRRNERSKGKEGGRVVRKLLAEWVETPLQRAVSARPEEYRACGRVALEFAPPGSEGAAPAVTVRFEPAEAAGERAA